MAELLSILKRECRQYTSFYWTEQSPKTNQQATMNPSSYHIYQNMLNHHPLPKFGHFTLFSIAGETATDYLEALKQKSISKLIVCVVFRMLTAIMRSA